MIQNIQIQEKVIYDIKGEFYYLPILYKPHYNIKKASLITNAIFKLLNSIAVYDKVDFDNKMGTAAEIKFNRFSKEIIKDGPVTKIKNGTNSINIPFYEFTLKNTLSIFTLRNSNSVKLLTDFFDLQFSRAKISAIKFSDNPNLAKSLHFVLEHDFLKSTVFLKKDNYNVVNYLDLNPSTAWNEFSNTYALYPSVLMLRLSLNDLQNLKKYNLNG